MEGESPFARVGLAGLGESALSFSELASGKLGLGPGGVDDFCSILDRLFSGRGDFSNIRAFCGRGVWSFELSVDASSAFRTFWLPVCSIRWIHITNISRFCYI
jgi:hypothetical protein